MQESIGGNCPTDTRCHRPRHKVVAFEWNGDVILDEGGREVVSGLVIHDPPLKLHPHPDPDKVSASRNAGGTDFVREELIAATVEFQAYLPLVLRSQ